MSREVHDHADNVMRPEALTGLSGIKFHEDSRAADIDYGTGKRQFPLRNRAHAAPEPQLETVSAPPFQRTNFRNASDLLGPSHGPE